MRRHILIVDDEELFREICRDMLDERGYRVTVTADAAAGMQVIATDAVDLLVADITLPGMDGLTMIEQVRELHPEIPAIVITGFLNQENMLRSLNLGVRGFLTKPFFYDELFQAVERALAQSQATRNQVLLHHYLPMIHLGEEILSVDHNELFAKTLSTALKIGLQQTGATQAFLAVTGPDGTLELATSLGVAPEEEPRLTEYLVAIRNALGSQDETLADDLLPGMTTLAVRMPGNTHFAMLVLARPKDLGGFQVEERKLARLLAIQAAIALHHQGSAAMVVSEAKDMRQVVCGLAHALAPEQTLGASGDDLARLGDLAVRVAKRLDMDTRDHETVRCATVLHGLGKVLTPPDLMGKPAPLTDAETAQVRAYVTLGAERLERTPILAPAAPYVAAHRERWDGTGYPEGLQGEAIPLGARIIGAVSAWGALTSARPYRKALTPEQAADTLRAGSGKSFDPAVVDALLEILEMKADSASG